MTGDRFQPRIREAEDGNESRIIEGYDVVA